ncbi:hypothetical protein DPMN_164463 [Dreissena polymorpha]|uniref:Uncharacterized protein n=1 Tax=Dreissena polymorpha TaxID=45954 RepID=A0A9D4EXV9_DREPO|nr:hypothetical protein DPMN_164463 [Dreissena polymorpha]
MDAVCCDVGSRQNMWDENLQQIAAAMRSAMCRSIGFTANRMMQGSLYARGNGLPIATS